MWPSVAAEEEFILKRFHTHIAVENIDTSIDFYSKLFGQPPTLHREGYAKWMLEDPRLNFAISARGHAVGVNHFGFQVDSADELAELKKRADAASPEGALAQKGVSCCFARSDKHWTIDPQGLAWEHFHTMAEAVEFGSEKAAQGEACCIPVRSSEQDASAAAATCCIANASPTTEEVCCG